jgi:hypothetical protein
MMRPARSRDEGSHTRGHNHGETSHPGRRAGQGDYGQCANWLLWKADRRAFSGNPITGE